MRVVLTVNERISLPRIAEQSRNREGNGGNVGNKEQTDEQYDKEWHNFLYKLCKWNLTDTAGNKQVDTDRRSNEANGQVNDHNETEVNDVHTVPRHNRIEDRRKDKDRGVRFQQAATGQKQQIDDQQDHDLIVAYLYAPDEGTVL